MYVDLDEYESAFQVYGDAALIAQQVSYQFQINYLGLAQARLARLRGRFREATLYLARGAGVCPGDQFQLRMRPVLSRTWLSPIGGRILRLRYQLS